ncbi:MAG: competence/damage-inducible protein A [Euryarchaeota archaeon]|nr:competence/damage-inducible protein A [Euryarchaeota archaeon]
MNIEIVHIGDELLTAEIDPYPTQMIRMIKEKGASVNMVTVLGDDFAGISRVLRSAGESDADLLIVTGGLGPTLDDITKNVVADYLGVGLKVHQEAVEWLSEAVKRMYGKKPVLSEETLRMATIPEGTIALRNIVGAACGVEARKGRMTIFCLPGFPKEMLPMFQEYILPRIESDEIFEKEIRAWRGETTMEPLFQTIVRKYKVRIASLPDEGWREKGNRIIVKGERREVEMAIEELSKLIEESRDAFLDD